MTNLKPRIRENRWGNWYGYLGNRKVEWFMNDDNGTQEENAKKWLANMQATLGQESIRSNES